MIQKLPLSDFRAVRHKLEPHEFAISEGQDIAPTNLIDEETWAGITHLPDDVAIRISDHNGHRLALLYRLSRDWITATGDFQKPDELFNCMLDAGDAFQCTNFLFLHGYYRAAMAELRVALELVMIGAYGNLKPDDPDYIVWKTRGSELGFTRFRKRLHGMLRSDQCKWLSRRRKVSRQDISPIMQFHALAPKLKRRCTMEKQRSCVCTRSSDAHVLYDGVCLRHLLSSHTYCAATLCLTPGQSNSLRGGLDTKSRRSRESF
jgi:hypothetical protein